MTTCGRPADGYKCDDKDVVVVDGERYCKGVFDCKIQPFYQVFGPNQNTGEYDDIPCTFACLLPGETPISEPVNENFCPDEFLTNYFCNNLQQRVKSYCSVGNCNLFGCNYDGRCIERSKRKLLDSGAGNETMQDKGPI